jgi:hypothetical protein
MGLTALQRRKAHTMAAFLNMHHRSIGSPIDREVSGSACFEDVLLINASTRESRLTLRENARIRPALPGAHLGGADHEGDAVV